MLEEGEGQWKEEGEGQGTEEGEGQEAYEQENLYLCYLSTSI